MGLATGTRLGPYEIQSPVGAGGMGEVYRARDTRLDRIVALKVLPAHIAHDALFRERFEREARAISALEHPAICALYDVGEADGMSYIVMQFLEGQTLAERLARGPLPMAEALAIAMQVAEALAVAHRAGIIHRDLKPANVMLLRNSGSTPTAKLLDFGLAKIAASPVEVIGGPTRTQEPLTAQGTILGTFQYMAPEQIEGEEADARSDIFSFGVLLYEMLSGRRAFEGKTHASLFGAILKEHPPAITTLQPQTPPALEQLLRACLAKNPNERIQTAHDVWLQLRWIAEGGSQVGVPAVVSHHRRRREQLLAAAAVAFLATAIALGALLFTAPAAEPPIVARFSVTLDAKQQFTRTGRHFIAVSADGRQLVYVANNQLYLRKLNEQQAAPIRGSDVDPIEPFFSPDGRWIAFGTAARELRKLPTEGGSPVRLAAIDLIYGASWAANGLYVGQGSSIIRVPADGGTPETIVTAASGTMVGHPQLVADGRTLLYTRATTTRPDWSAAEAVLRDLASGQERVVARDGGDFKYVPTGHLLFGRGEDMYAARLNLADAAAEGAVPVVEGVRVTDGTGSMQLAISTAGTAAYVASSDVVTTPLVWLDRAGRQTPMPLERAFEDFSLSPDGKFVATTLDTTPRSIWIVDLERHTVTRLTFGADRRDPIWTPDGKRVAYTALDGGVYWKAPDGSGREEQLVPPAGGRVPLDITKDGKWLMHLDSTGNSIKLHALAGADESNRPNLPEAASAAKLSPDGRWLAYVVGGGVRNAAGGDLFVTPFPAGGAIYQVSQQRAHDPVWHPNGRELFYRNGGEVLSVTIEAGSSFKASTPRVLFNAPEFANRGPDFGYDAVTDRFMLLPQGPGGGEIHVITNWFHELLERVPAARR